MTMRIHTNTLNQNDLADAAKMARVTITSGIGAGDVRGSRSHKYAFEVTLTGESRRRPQGWSRGQGSDDAHAATWDQWGVFLSVLFDRDPEMVCGSVKSPTYADRYDFDRKTNGRFAPTDTNGVRYDMNPGTTAPIGRYWPADAHGDHKWDFQGVRADNAIVHRCTKCSATQIRFP